MRRLLAVPLLLAMPSAARACAVCGAAVDRNRSIFLVTTILLSLLPLVLVGAGLLWIALRSRGRLAEEFAEREEPYPVAGAFPVAGAGAGVQPGGAPIAASPTLGTQR